MYGIHYCGYNIHNPDRDKIIRPHGSGDYLFLLLLSPMNFELTVPADPVLPMISSCPILYETLEVRTKPQNGKLSNPVSSARPAASITQKIRANPGACILYTPGYPQHYQAIEQFFNSFVHFECHCNFLPNYSFPVNEIFYPQDINEINWYLKKIQTEYLMKNLHYTQRSSALIEELLIQLERDYQNQGPDHMDSRDLYDSFQELRLHMLTNCEEEWDIGRMCQLVHLEKTQLYTHYQNLFHISPKSDLIRARMDKAKYLLTNEAMQINQVAIASGFHNVYHFTRYFKKICGCTPKEYARRRSSFHQIL